MSRTSRTTRPRPRRRRLLALAAVVGLVVPGLVLAPATASGTSKIVYDQNGHIWMANPDGSSPVDLTPTGWSSPNLVDPSLSPDGSRVALVSMPAGFASTDVYLIPAAPTTQAQATRLTSNSVADMDPAWSPNGRKIAYTHDSRTNREENEDVWTMNADGTGKTQLTTDTVGDSDTAPAWSPDGTKIAYTTTSDHYGCFDDNFFYFIAFDQVHVMSSTGTGSTNVVDDSSMVATSPDWSPNGSTLAYDGQVYTLGADTGSGPTCQSAATSRIYTQAASGSGARASLPTGHWPAWSPDGTHIVASSDGSQTLFTMNADGSGAKTLPVTGRFPDWGVLAAAKTATTTTLTVTVDTKVHAKGAVKPGVGGQSAKVTLSRKVNGVFSKVTTKTVTLGSTGGYATSFSRPPAGTCKVTTRYPGDASHLASSTSRTFAC